MAARTKTRRRLRILGFTLLALAITAAGAYTIRKQQIARNVLALRAEGYAALEAGDYFNAMHKIGPYVQRNRTDTEALLKYAQARQNVPAPNGKNISDAMSLYRQLLELDPQ